jgi:chorismate synthase
MSLKALRLQTAGESHGPQCTIILDNIPAGLPLSTDQVNRHLTRRQGGYGRGGRMKIERDQVQFVSGVRYGETLGSPIAMVVANLDWANWAGKMDIAEPAERVAKVTKMRPGHADFTGAVKYSHDDVRNVLERASSRETTSRVAAGSVCRAFLEYFGIEIFSHTVRIGEIEAHVPDEIRLDKRGSKNRAIAAFFQSVEESAVRTGDAASAQRMIEAIDAARAEGDTLGGVFEVVAYNVPIGLGSFAQWEDRLDGRIVGALGSIPSIKGAEVGDGFAEAARRGSKVHDVISYNDEQGWLHDTNNAGGTEGGITNGAPIIARAAAKPIATLMKPLPSTDLATRERAVAHVERSDVCVIPAAGVVGEAMLAIVLADAFRQKFGGDSVAEIERNYRSYIATYEPAVV